MPVHTPGSIGGGGNDDQGVATDNLAIKYPNSVDALPGMIYPDSPGGPDSNAPRLPDAQAHYPAKRYPTTPGVAPPIRVGTVASPVPFMPTYGAVLGTWVTQTTPEE